MKKFSLLLASLLVSAGALAAAADMVTVDILCSPGSPNAPQPKPQITTLA
jgi:hypothetical protein